MDDAVVEARKLFKYSRKLAKKHSAYLSASAAKHGLNLDNYMSDDGDDDDNDDDAE